MVAGIPRNGDELQDSLAAPPLLFNFEPQENPLAARPVLVPQGAYGSSMFDELGQFGVTVKEIGPDQVRSIKGTAAVAVLNNGSGVVQTAERPGIVVFADAYE
jgi:hypothetical protein